MKNRACNNNYVSKGHTANKGAVGVLILALLLGAAACFLGFSGTASAGRIVASNIVTLGADMEVTTGASAPSSTGLKDDKKGLLFTSEKRGASFSFTDTFSGVFEAEYRVYSDATYSGTWNASQFINTALDLKEVQFTFENTVTKESFDLYVAGGEAYGSNIPSARVKRGSVTVGQHYLKGETKESTTELKNYAQLWTRLHGTTYSNNTYLDAWGSVTAESKPTVIGFDPRTMEVYGTNYNFTTGAKERRVILDMKNASLIGEKNTLESFENYTVKVTFSSITSGRKAKMLLYSVNGQPLAAEINEDSSGANVIIGDVYKAVAGEKSLLPEVIGAYDFGTGCIDFDGTVRVKTPSGDWIAATKEDGKYYFTPATAGMYTVEIVAKDEGGNAGTAYEVPVEVLAICPAPEISYEFKLAEQDRISKLGTGSKLDIPAAFGYSELSGALKVAISHEYPDGKTDIESGELALIKAGTNKIVYSVTDILGKTYKEEFIFETDDGAVFGASSLKKSYKKDTYLDLPDIDVKAGGVSLETVKTLFYPDGRGSTQNTVPLNTAGEYRLQYKTTTGGKTYEKNEYFKVDSDASALFLPSDAFTLEAGAKTADYVDINGGGLAVTTNKDGASLVYDGVINLSENTLNDMLLKFIALPKESGKSDMTRILFTFRDIHDPSIYMTINIRQDFWGQNESVRVSVKTDSMTDYFTRGYYNNQVIYAYGEIGGARCYQAFHGKFKESFVTRPMEIYYDYEDKALYVYPLIYYVADNQPWKFADLDDASSLGSSVWKGFTTGEVYFSVSMEGLTGTSSTLLLMELNGNDLSGKTADSVPPSISVNFDGQNPKSLPEGETGKPYKLFAAAAYDITDGERPVSVYVYKKNSGGLVRQTIDDKNMTFTPESAGDYIVSYSAEDISGNRNEKVLEFSVYDVLSEISLDFGGYDIPASIFAGESLLLREPFVSGGSGVKTLSRSITFDGNPVTAENNTLYAEKPGTYRITYKVRDYVKETEIVYTVAVTAGDVPVVTLPSVPVAILDGYEYEFAPLRAVIYDGARITDAKNTLTVTYKGTSTPVDGYKYKPEVDNSGDVITLTYRAQNPLDATKYWENSYDVTVIKPVSLGEYFSRDGFAMEYTENSVVFTATSDTNRLDYINKLIADGFEFKFKVLQTANNFESVDIYLTDTVEVNEQVIISIVKASTTYSTLKINGAEAGRINNATFFGSSAPFAISLNAKTGAIYDSMGDRIGIITTFMSGKTFNGFSSDKAFFSAKLAGIEGDAAIEVLLLGNQLFYDADEDFVKPMIFVSEEFQYLVAQGSSVKVPYAFASDLLSPETSCVVTVTAPDGTEIYKNAAIDEDLYFTASQFGYYTIQYIARDGAGNRSAPDYSIRVIDFSAPEITVSGSVPMTQKAGKEVVLPSATAVDDVSGEVSCQVFVRDPYGNMVTLVDRKFTPTVKGTYHITYTAADDFGNISVKSFYMTVS